MSKDHDVPVARPERPWECRPFWRVTLRAERTPGGWWEVEQEKVTRCLTVGAVPESQSVTVLAAVGSVHVEWYGDTPCKAEAQALLMDAIRKAEGEREGGA